MVNHVGQEEGIFPVMQSSGRSLNSWEMYISKQNQTLTIETSEYHPGLLCLTKKDLHDIIKAMSK